MKKIIFYLLSFVSLTFSFESFAKELSLYLPSDRIRVPVLGKEWKILLENGKARVEYVGLPAGINKSSIKLIREPLSPDQKNPAVWQNKVTSDLKRKYSKIEVQKMPNTQYQINYSYSKDLIPVVGATFYVASDRWLYQWQCELEKNSSVNAVQWCARQFQKIEWSNQLPLHRSKQVISFENFVKTLPLDEARLRKMEAKMVSAFQMGLASTSQFYEYGSFLIFKSLFFPPPNEEAKMILLGTLGLLADTLQPFPQFSSFLIWMKTHRDYLQGKLTYPQIEKTGQLEYPPPYWLLAMWVEPLNHETAAYLARRQVAKNHVHDYVLGKLLMDENNTTEAIAFLKKAARDKDSLPLSSLAKAYVQAKQIPQAKTIANTMVRKNSKNVDSWLLMADVLTKDHQRAPEADKIYDRLSTKENSSREEKIKINLLRAKTSQNLGMSLIFYEKVLDLDPYNLEALYSAGRLSILETNDKKKGLQFMARYLNTAPRDDPRVSELIGLIQDLKPEHDHEVPIYTPYPGSNPQ